MGRGWEKSAWTALALGWMILASNPAGATIRFECGTYSVQGKIELPAEDAVEPTLVLWSGTISELRIPVSVPEGIGARLRSIGKSPVAGEFELAISTPGAKPTHGAVRAFRFSSVAAVKSREATARLLHSEPCNGAGR